MEPIQPEIVEEATPTQEEPVKTQAPITDVGTFWQRLDEVLQLVKSGGTANNKLESILETFEETAQINQTPYRSFIFQPERMSITSNDDVIPNNEVVVESATKNGGHQPAETFSQFRIRFEKSLVNVKSIQLLSAVIPNAIQNIPDNQLIFFYYRLRNLTTSNLGNWTLLTTYFPGDIVTYSGSFYVVVVKDVAAAPGPPSSNPSYQLIDLAGVDLTRPNYYDLNPYRIQIVMINPTFGFPYEDTGNELLYNRTFQDYNDLATTLNACANDVQTASLPGDISFLYNTTLNKFQVQGSKLANGYFYMPCGYEDANVQAIMTSPNYTAGNIDVDGVLAGYDPTLIYSKNYSLNLRLGFTWNGLYTNPLSIDPYGNIILAENVYWYLRGKDPYYLPPEWTPNLLTANSYADLVNTSCVRVYCDTTFGSTQDSTGGGGLLSIVPVNTTNLGVGFYQNNFNNPLTKIPRIIPEINIRLINDQGQPYLLPNSATITLELAMEYY